jgi:TPR repeat protein
VALIHMMSSEAEAEADICCANCGAAEVDDIELEECNDCDLVKYCSDKCREDHREQHEEECKNWVKELHDKKLFEQPDETHRGDCPLCFLPLPLDRKKSIFYTCCSESICKGCAYANHLSNGNSRCPFCREPRSKKEDDRRLMKRIEANDPAALSQMGGERYNEGDYDDAFEYWTKAAELGDFEAHYRLGMYYKGDGVEKDEEMEVHHYEKAAIGGHPFARHNLACIEEENGNIERAVNHFIIAANLGDEDSMKALWTHYSLGNVTKEELDATLRTHQAAIDATKSEQRDAVEAIFRNRI